jgi:hypothetical protein
VCEIWNGGRMSTFENAQKAKAEARFLDEQYHKMYAENKITHEGNTTDWQDGWEAGWKFCYIEENRRLWAVIVEMDQTIETMKIYQP